MDQRTTDTSSNTLLADLQDISGLPLADLQFLGRRGLLRTYLAKIPPGRYTLEAWRAGLSVLYDRPIRFSSMEEVERWLAGAAGQPESNERPFDKPF